MQLMKEKMASDLSAPYEVVIATFSLGMQDIRAAVEKMMQSSSRYSTFITSLAPHPGKYSGRCWGQGCTAVLIGPTPRAMCSTICSIRWASILKSDPSSCSTNPYASLDEAVAALSPQACTMVEPLLVESSPANTPSLSVIRFSSTFMPPSWSSPNSCFKKFSLMMI